MTKREIAVVAVLVVIAGVLAVGIISLFTPTPVTRINAPYTPTAAYHPDLSISMEVIEGWGQGGYQLEIDGNGNVSYEKSIPGWPLLNQKRSGKLNPQQIEALVAAIKKANLWAIWAVKHPFLGGYICMDCPKIDLSFTLNGQSEHISHSMPDWECNTQGSPPKALCDLENQIAGIRYLDVYVPPTPSPTPTPTSTPLSSSKLPATHPARSG